MDKKNTNLDELLKVIAASGAGIPIAGIRVMVKKADEEPVGKEAADKETVGKKPVNHKPADKADALRMLTALQGRHHTVFTGVTVRQGDRSLTESETTEVYFRPATEAELRAYIATGEPMDKAGSYGVQGKGALLVEKLNGDFFNVMGLPVLRLSRMLAQFGVNLL